MYLYRKLENGTKEFLQENEGKVITPELILELQKKVLLKEQQVILMRSTFTEREMDDTELDCPMTMVKNYLTP